VDLRTGLDDLEKRKFLTLPGLELRPLCRPARSQSLNRLRYPGSHNILIRWKNYSQLLSVHRVSAVRQTEIHTAEPLVPDPWPCEVEIAIAKLKRYKSSGSDQIPE
jgi:hypothetical protein